MGCGVPAFDGECCCRQGACSCPCCGVVEDPQAGHSKGIADASDGAAPPPSGPAELSKALAELTAALALLAATAARNKLRRSGDDWARIASAAREASSLAHATGEWCALGLSQLPARRAGGVVAPGTLPVRLDSSPYHNLVRLVARMFRVAEALMASTLASAAVGHVLLLTN